MQRGEEGLMSRLSLSKNFHGSWTGMGRSIENKRIVEERRFSARIQALKKAIPSQKQWTL
ncbi:hypothetical protein GT037_009577, partial [Alternaria burnsii]